MDELTFWVEDGVVSKREMRGKFLEIDRGMTWEEMIKSG